MPYAKYVSSTYSEILAVEMGFAMTFRKWLLLALLAVLPNVYGERAQADPSEINTLVSGIRALGYEIPEFAQISASCDGDAMCAARFLKDSIGLGASIIPAIAVPPARTGWSNQKAPLRVVPSSSSGAIVLEFHRFDAQFLYNVLNRLAIVPKKMILDVRGVKLSDELGEVRRTASLFTGKLERAFRLIHATGREVDWQIPKPKTHWPDEEITVRIDNQTPGNALAFAAILKRYTNTEIEGGILPEQIFLHHIVPIMHGWDMMVPSGEVRIPE